VVWLYDVEGYSHEEIAAMFGRTTSFSKSQLARGHGRLRGWLDANSAAEGAQCAALKL
jgi:RNA polymerase sigma-70 factor (ECF subfamily)